MNNIRDNRTGKISNCRSTFCEEPVKVLSKFEIQLSVNYSKLWGQF
jgi:hypothetical protein